MFPKDIVNQNQMTKLEQNQNQKATHNSEKARALKYGWFGNKGQLHPKLAAWPWGNVLPSLDLKSFNDGEEEGLFIHCLMKIHVDRLDSKRLAEHRHKITLVLLSIQPTVEGFLCFREVTGTEDVSDDKKVKCMFPWNLSDSSWASIRKEWTPRPFPHKEHTECPHTIMHTVVKKLRISWNL